MSSSGRTAIPSAKHVFLRHERTELCAGKSWKALFSPRIRRDDGCVETTRRPTAVAAVGYQGAGERHSPTKGNAQVRVGLRRFQLVHDISQEQSGGAEREYTLISAAVKPNGGRPSSTKAEMGLVIFHR